MAKTFVYTLWFSWWDFSSPLTVTWSRRANCVKYIHVNDICPKPQTQMDINQRSHRHSHNKCKMEIVHFGPSHHQSLHKNKTACIKTRAKTHTGVPYLFMPYFRKGNHHSLVFQFRNLEIINSVLFFMLPSQRTLSKLNLLHLTLEDSVPSLYSPATMSVSVCSDHGASFPE